MAEVRDAPYLQDVLVGVGGVPYLQDVLVRVGTVPYLQDVLVRVGDVPAAVVYESPNMTGQLYGKCLDCLPILILHQSEISTCTLIYT